MARAVPPRFVLPLWLVADAILTRAYRIKPLRPDGSGIIRFDLRRYKGRTRVLDDGSTVQTGDIIMELHLNNDWFKQRRNLNLKASQSPQQFLTFFAEELRLLARQMDTGMFDNVAALHGITLLHVAAKRLRFEIHDLPDTVWNRGARFYTAGLMRLYHLRPEETSKLPRKEWQLKEVWLSRTALLKRYGQTQS